jgi:transcriptional regulator of heat shock response
MSLAILQHVEFVRLKRHLVMAILVSPTGIVYHRVVEVEEDFSQPDLDHLSDYMNSFLTGLTLQQASERLIDQMMVEKSIYDRHRSSSRLAQGAFSKCRDRCLYWGERISFMSLSLGRYRS